MQQFLVATVRPGAVLELDGSDYHYLVRVRRLAPGAVIPVADAAGLRAQATVTEIGAATVRLHVAAEPGDQVPEGNAAAPALTLIQALPKGTLMDRIVRQATELGVTSIVPVVAERTQGRADGAAQARRRERWQRIARQAAQQSAAAAPVIEAPVPLCDVLAQHGDGGLDLAFHPGAAPLLPEHIGARQRAICSAHVRGALVRGGEVRCAVGPEGGFSPEEVDLFRRHGFRLVGLPTGLLRVDTAVVAALTAAVQFRLSAP